MPQRPPRRSAAPGPGRRPGRGAGRSGGKGAGTQRDGKGAQSGRKPAPSGGKRARAGDKPARGAGKRSATPVGGKESERRRSDAGPRRRDRADRPDWGGLTRRGARRLSETGGDSGRPSPPDREVADEARGAHRGRATDRPSAQGPLPTGDAGEPETWTLEEVRSEASEAVGRAGGATRPPSKRGASKRSAGKAERSGVTGQARARSASKSRSPQRGAAAHAADDGPGPQARPKRPKQGPGPAGDAARKAGSPARDLRNELQSEVGAGRAARLEAQLDDAGRSFSRGRYPEARSQLRKLIQQAPGSASVRELLGLTYYRLGQWKDAARELEAFGRLTGSVEQHPVLADCMRGLGRHDEVAGLWQELREASPSADLVAEGRIVMAGSFADRGRLADAIRVLSGGRWRVKRPREHHLRMAYALGDLYERAGDLPQARAMFAWVARYDRAFADADQRLQALG